MNTSQAHATISSDDWNLRHETPPPLLLTVRQAAARLGVGRTTAYGLIASGDLEVVHIGRAARVPATAVDELVARLRKEQSTAMRSPTGSVDA